MTVRSSLTIVLAAGEFDLSIAAAASFGGAVSGILISQYNFPLFGIIPIVLVAGIYLPGPLVAWFQNVAKLLG